MEMKKIFGIIFFVIGLLLLAFSVSALEIPSSLQKVIDYATQQAQSLSLLIAFFGGVLSVLSPCILPILPAFFAYTFKERRQITKMTFVFFLGMASVFTLMGITAGFIGRFLETYREQFTFFAGFLLILFGILIFFQKGINFLLPKPKMKQRNNILGTFFFGVFFTFGFSPCVGTILTAILFLAATINNYLYSGLLLFTYSLGIIFPLFIIAFFYDKYNLAENRFIKGKPVTFKLFNKEIYTHTSSIIAGSLFILIGALFVAFRSTAFANTIDPFKTKQYFYNLHNTLINWGIPREAGNILGLFLLIIIFAAVFSYIKKYGGIKGKLRKGIKKKLKKKK